MDQLYLMPGEEHYTKFQDENGVPKIRYTYCSLHGKPAVPKMKSSGCAKIGSGRKTAAT